MKPSTAFAAPVFSSGVHFPAEFSTGNDLIIPSLSPDHAFIAASSAKPNAEELVTKQATAAFDVGSKGARLVEQARVVQLDKLVSLGETLNESQSEQLSNLGGETVVDQGEVRRTFSVRVSIAAALLLAAAILVADLLLLRSFAIELNPALAGDWLALAGQASPLLCATMAFKIFAVLYFRDAAARARFDKYFSIGVLVAVPVVLLALAYRFTQWSANPMAGILNEGNPQVEMAISVGAFLAQLLAQAVIGAGAIFTAEKLAHISRPSSVRHGPGYTQVYEAFLKDARILEANRSQLIKAKARLAALEGALHDYVSRSLTLLEADSQQQARIEVMRGSAR